MDKIKLYKKAVTKWGEESQILMAIEEMGELIQALSKYFRQPNKSFERRFDNIEQEIADVSIMIEQLKCIFSENTINQMIEKKLERLEARLNGQD